MTKITRRTALGQLAASTGAIATIGSTQSPSNAAAPRQIGPLGNTVKHVVILMQENRSFDHYLGSLSGVRGFSDPQPFRYHDGHTIFEQKSTSRGYFRPYHLDTTQYNAQQAADLDHSWVGTHKARNNGWWDRWIPAKSRETMGHFTRHDVPFHYALADAYTICDQYFCSLLGPTTPNRLYHWTGQIDPRGLGGGPVTSNPPSYRPAYSWTTYPERLEAAGVSWQVYANDEVGEATDNVNGWVGDYGDNPLWLFKQYHDALANNQPLAQHGGLHNGWKPNSGQGKNVSHVLEQFINDCSAGTLPQVSWVVAPYRYSEHPAARPADGENYAHRVIQAVWANPQLWANTAIIINYDENDGFFDHVIPPNPPQGTPDEFVDNKPIGLGPRVPLFVVSPWSKGGYVSSQVHDHTSVIRFLEHVTGVQEPNITAWRRSICGDLTNLFDFNSYDASIPTLPDTAQLVADADNQSSFPQQPLPTSEGTQPAQEPGQRKRRPVPYNITAQRSGSTVTITNSGTANAPVGVFSSSQRDAPVWVVVNAGATQTVTLPTSAGGATVYGPAGQIYQV